MSFFRAYQHLLPDSRAWRLTVDKMLRKFFLGLSSAPSDARDFVDLVYEDQFPATTRELSAWEQHHGVIPRALEADRRTNLAAAWKATGGQSPKYLQDTMQAHGFDIYIHEWHAAQITGNVTDAEQFDIAASTAGPQGFAFSNDGSRMFVAGDATNIVDSYDLSVAWDQSTAVIDESRSVGLQDTSPRDVAFSADGTRLYVLGQSSVSVHQYDLAAPWILTGMAFQGSFSLIGQTTVPTGLAISADGARVVVCGTTPTPESHQYVLSVAWDVTSAVFDVSVNIAADDALPRSLAFAEHGNALFVLGDQFNGVTQYTLAAPYDITGMARLTSMLTTPEDNVPVAIAYWDGGRKLFMHGSQFGLMHRFTVHRVLKNPLTWTVQPTTGLTQCGDIEAECGEIPPLQQGIGSAVCGKQLANPDAIGYIVNLNLTGEAPPSVPSDPATWPHFIYWGAAAFPTKANIAVERRYEFEHMLLKLNPAQDWIVTLVNYV